MAADFELIFIGRELKRLGYAFITVTPETHKRVLSRNPDGLAGDLRDVFGWNRWFFPDLLPGALYAALVTANALDRRDGLCRSRLRAATFHDLVFLHSEFPTESANAVFFGPDTYRFLQALQWASRSRARCVLDLGCGSGAGGIFLAPFCDQVILSDINPSALHLAQVNAAINQVGSCQTVLSDVCAQIQRPVDLIIANPPYIIDPANRLYRDGGGTYGTELSLRMVSESVRSLAPGGRLALYTGSPVVSGENIFASELKSLLHGLDADISLTELDPDVFGEELDLPAYAACDRIAVMFLTITMPAIPSKHPAPRTTARARSTRLPRSV
jgi:release factor glutamine methyltransferase